MKDPRLTKVGRTTTAVNFTGFTFGLTSQVSAYGIALLNTGMVATETVGLVLDSAATTSTGATWTLNTSAEWATNAADVFTGTTVLSTVPVRTDALAGYDNLSTGPTPAATPVPTPVLCQSGRVVFFNKGSRTYWEVGYVGILINAVQLPQLDQGRLTIEPRELRYGRGWKWSCSWDHVPIATAHAVRDIFQKTGGGAAPGYFSPVPGQKAVTTGVLSDAAYSPEMRGGVVRLLSVRTSERHAYNTEWYATLEIECESWQEVPTDGN
jgi:hypothetical protein